MGRIHGIILKTKHTSIRRKPCLSPTLSTTNLTRTGLKRKSGLRCVRPFRLHVIFHSFENFTGELALSQCLYTPDFDSGIAANLTNSFVLFNSITDSL